ncbi:Nuclear polyadenylated RNA-binding protein 4 [Cucumispora dikerogammari]|nr:Nuclear polyadenylated RNA-binding protein 4 [Cucumispora dikerogammari]
MREQQKRKSKTVENKTNSKNKTTQAKDKENKRPFLSTLVFSTSSEDEKIKPNIEKKNKPYREESSSQKDPISKTDKDMNKINYIDNRVSTNNVQNIEIINEDAVGGENKKSIKVNQVSSDYPMEEGVTAINKSEKRTLEKAKPENRKIESDSDSSSSVPQLKVINKKAKSKKNTVDLESSSDSQVKVLTKKVDNDSESSHSVAQLKTDSKKNDTRQVIDDSESSSLAQLEVFAKKTPNKIGLTDTEATPISNSKLSSKNNSLKQENEVSDSSSSLTQLKTLGKNTTKKTDSSNTEASSVLGSTGLSKKASLKNQLSDSDSSTVSQPKDNSKKLSNKKINVDSDSSTVAQSKFNNKKLSNKKINVDSDSSTVAQSKFNNKKLSNKKINVDSDSSSVSELKVLPIKSKNKKEVQGLEDSSIIKSKTGAGKIENKQRIFNSDTSSSSQLKEIKENILKDKVLENSESSSSLSQLGVFKKKVRNDKVSKKTESLSSDQSKSSKRQPECKKELADSESSSVSQSIVSRKKKVRIQETQSSSTSEQNMKAKTTKEQTQSKITGKKNKNNTTQDTKNDESSLEEWIPKEKKVENNSEINKVIVKNIPLNLTEADIKSEFSKFGTISALRMPPPYEKSGINTHRGICFIEFESASSLSKALKLTQIGDDPIWVVKAEENYKTLRDANSVFVGNLCYDVDEDELRNFFPKNIEIGDITMPRNQAGRGRGFAFMKVLKGMDKVLKSKFLFKERVLKIHSAETNTRQDRAKNKNRENYGNKHEGITKGRNEGFGHNRSDFNKNENVRNRNEYGSKQGGEYDNRASKRGKYNGGDMNTQNQKFNKGVSKNSEDDNSNSKKSVYDRRDSKNWEERKTHSKKADFNKGSYKKLEYNGDETKASSYNKNKSEKSEYNDKTESKATEYNRKESGSFEYNKRQGFGNEGGRNDKSGRKDYKPSSHKNNERENYKKPNKIVFDDSSAN